MPEAPRTTPKHCRGTRKDGRACTAPVLGDGTYCYAHDPGRAADRDSARSKGGQNRANIVRLAGLCPPRLLGVFDKLEKALDEVHAGTLDPKQAGAMASLAGAMTRVLSTGEVEAKLREIEAQLARQTSQEPAA